MNCYSIGITFGVGGALARASLPRGLVALVPLSAVSLFQLFYPPCLQKERKQKEKRKQSASGTIFINDDG